MTVSVYADLRWRPGTGIGAVQSALLSRVPKSLRIADLGITMRIGSPLSPAAISTALGLCGSGGGVFWSPGYMPPLISTLPAVVTVHDLTHLHFYSKVHTGYYNAVMKHLYRRCCRIICVSEYTRAEFLEWSGVSADRVVMIHNGIGPVFRGQSGTFGLQFPYVLYPGNRRPYKNVSGMLEAYAASRLSNAGIHFVLTGMPEENLHRLAERLGVVDYVHCVGYVPEENMAGLYKGATLVAFVSMYEGFGLPIVEAMAMGVPVVTSNVSAMPEISGGAAVLVSPTSIDEMSDAMEQVAFDRELRQRLIALGRARAGEFNWDISAKKVWDVVESAARNP